MILGVFVFIMSYQNFTLDPKMARFAPLTARLLNIKIGFQVFFAIKILSRTIIIDYNLERKTINDSKLSNKAGGVKKCARRRRRETEIRERRDVFCENSLR